MLALATVRLTVRASPPEDHFSLVDAEPVVVGCLQAWPGTHRTVDIDRDTAGATDQMVVVVIDAIFVASGRTCGLDPANEASIGQGSEGVVDGLPRDRPDLGSHERFDVVGGAMRRARHRSEDRQPLCRHLDSTCTKQLGWIGGPIGHDRTMSPILDSVKISRVR